MCALQLWACLGAGALLNHLCPHPLAPLPGFPRDLESLPSSRLIPRALPAGAAPRVGAVPWDSSAEPSQAPHCASAWRWGKVHFFVESGLAAGLGLQGSGKMMGQGWGAGCLVFRTLSSISLGSKSISASSHMTLGLLPFCLGPCFLIPGAYLHSSCGSFPL